MQNLKKGWYGICATKVLSPWAQNSHNNICNNFHTNEHFCKLIWQNIQENIVVVNFHAHFDIKSKYSHIFIYFLSPQYKKKWIDLM
jgi:hypothetical protein